MNWLDLLQVIVPYFAIALGGFILRRMKRPNDHERAALLVTIANAVVASVVVRYPREAWIVLLANAIREIANIVGSRFPEAAVRREATRALRDAGIALP